MNSPLPIKVAIAIIYQKDQFLMQLRDEVPNIVYPGHWGLFGGHIEASETPEKALMRELKEEINYQTTNITKFACYKFPQVIRHVYYTPLTVSVNQLILEEGWDLALLSRENIIQGYCYSHQANQIKPLGKPHQQILLDFIAANII